MRIIADKVPELGSYPCAYHLALGAGNLLGHDVPMDGRVILPHHGRPVVPVRLVAEGQDVVAFEGGDRDAGDMLEADLPGEEGGRIANSCTLNVNSLACGGQRSTTLI